MEVVIEKPTTKAIHEGYKGTEVGVIPEDWEVNELGSIVEIVSGGTPSTKNPEYWDGNINWCTPTDITATNSKYINGTDRKITELGLKNSSASLLPEGAILLCSRATVGEAKIAKTNISTNQGFKSLICHGDVYNEYLFYLIISNKDKFIEKAYGSTFLEISKKNTKRIKFAFPILEEQRAIAEALSDVDALIAALDALIQKKQQIKKGAMQQLLTGKKRLPGFDGEWEEKTLGDICQIVNGGTPSTKIPKYWDGQIPWCTPTDITSTKGRVIAKTERNITKTGLNKSSATLLPKGALLLCSRATIGEIKIAACEIATNQGFKSLVCLEGINNEFLYYLIILQKQKFIDKAFGSTFLEISKKNTQDVEFEFPKLEEQKAIAQILSDMDAEIQVLQAKRSKYQKIKQGMMQELLTGKTRLVNKQEKQNETEQKSGHNWQIDETVLISVLADRFGSKKYPMGRFRRTKLSYLVRRFLASNVDQFLKKAAGPYNPNTRYSGPEKIALDNGYVQECGKYSGFIADENIAEAQEYFEGWHGLNVLDWLDDGFRYKKNEDLELLTTVDKSIVELREKDKEVSSENVKDVIASHPEWEAKLERDLFSDENIEGAIEESLELFR